MKLSIIIPVYNVEDFLEKCVESAICQGVENEDYEILLINDGSTDRSGEIAQELAGKYSSVRYIEQENKGLGGARNIGVEDAVGEYIMFLDSDDWLDENSLNSLLQEAFSKDLDLLIFKMKRVYVSGEVIEGQMDYPPYQVYSGKDFILKNRVEILPCATLYRRKLLVENGIKFLEKIYYEDVDFYLKSVLKAKKVMYVPKAIYNYFFNENSITLNTKPVHNQKKIVDYGKALLRISEITEKESNEIKERLDFIKEKYMRFWMKMIYNNSLDYNVIKEVIREMKQRRIYPFSIKQNLLESNEKAQLYYFNHYMIRCKILFEKRYPLAVFLMKLNKRLNIF